MTRTISASATAARAIALVEALQSRFRHALEDLARAHADVTPFASIEWLRDDGRHGGGLRYVKPHGPVFNRAAINLSHVHYDDDPQRKLGSASALSTIIHPRHPRAPSVHIHISWTERKDGSGYWRMMADLNPAISLAADTERFTAALRAVAPAQLDEATAQGDRYFFIPALERHRGAVHFYLEGYASDDSDADTRLAQRFGEAITDRYVELLGARLGSASEPTPDEIDAQLAYHSVYLFQVLTLDRGTTSGILVHDQNDVGIMGSLPSFVDRELLASWRARVPAQQVPLLEGIVAALPNTGDAPCPVSDATRGELAKVLRHFYRVHPEALELQARGNILPPTVANHRR